MPHPAVELIGLNKSFGATHANVDVNLRIAVGEIHALVGENGAGKTTLMKMLFGLYRPDSGAILVGGRKVSITSPQAAIALGIGMVHQHFMLVPSLTVAENIVLGMEPRTGRFGLKLFVDSAAAADITMSLAERFGLHVDAGAAVRDLSVGLRQRVEILKALARGAKILILDEPTAVLTPQETIELFGILRSLVAEGMTIVFISHKLREVLEVSDTVSVMRMGRLVGTIKAWDTTPAALAKMMIGRDRLPEVTRTPASRGEVVLRLADVIAEDDRGARALQGMSFDVHRGEILGIAGVEGNGQAELVEVVVGVRPIRQGTLSLDGADISQLSTRKRRESGIAAIPEDRLHHGVAQSASIQDNLAMSRYYRPPLTVGPFLSPSRLSAFARNMVARSDIRTLDTSLAAGSLSGGNMQKLVVAREIGLEPRLLVAAQPTRGVDIGAIEDIHARLIKERDRGTAVLLVSAELTEVMALSDRIVVIYEGRITGTFNAGTVTEEELGLYMLGVKRQEGNIA